MYVSPSHTLECARISSIVNMYPKLDTYTTEVDSFTIFYTNPLPTTSTIIIICRSHTLIPVMCHCPKLLVCNSKVGPGSSTHFHYLNPLTLLVLESHNNCSLDSYDQHLLYRSSSSANHFFHRPTHV